MNLNSNFVVSILVAFCTFFIAKVLFPAMSIIGLVAISAVVTALVYFVFMDDEAEEQGESEQEFFTEGFPDVSDEQTPAPTENEKSKPARKPRKKKEEQ